MKIKARIAPKVRPCVDELEDPTWCEWVCGNTPIFEGFHPCNADGNIAEETAEDRMTDCYVYDGGGACSTRPAVKLSVSEPESRA